MLFSQPRARRNILILLSMLSAGGLSACVTAPPVFQNANPCSTLVPDDWFAAGGGIKSAPLPANDTAGAWVSFGEQQTGQLDKANAQTRDAVTIVKKCEARDQAAFDALQPTPWWHFW